MPPQPEQEKARRAPDDLLNDMLYDLIRTHEGLVMVLRNPAQFLNDPNNIVCLVQVDISLWNCLLLAGECDDKDKTGKDLSTKIQEAERLRTRAASFEATMPMGQRFLLNDISAFIGKETMLYQDLLSKLQKKGLGVSTWRDYKPSKEAVKRMGEGGDRFGNWKRTETPGPKPG